MLHILSYFSTASSKFQNSDLSKIMDTAVSTNRGLGVTGLLCYRDRCFVQFLEGDESIVKNLYEKIKKDDRHTGCFVLMEDSIDKRLFAQWDMALANVDDFKGQQRELLLELFKVSLDKKSAAHARITALLLDTFKRSQLFATTLRLQP